MNDEKKHEEEVLLVYERKELVIFKISVEL